MNETNISDDVRALAIGAGLQAALEQFPGDVAAAFGSARAASGGLVAPDDPRAEPWPPMRVGTSA